MTEINLRNYDQNDLEKAAAALERQYKFEKNLLVIGKLPEKTQVHEWFKLAAENKPFQSQIMSLRRAFAAAQLFRLRAPLRLMLSITQGLPDMIDPTSQEIFEDLYLAKLASGLENSGNRDYWNVTHAIFEDLGFYSDFDGMIDQAKPQDIFERILSKSKVFSQIGEES